MKLSPVFITLVCLVLMNCKSHKNEDTEESNETITKTAKEIPKKPVSDIIIDPITHATTILEWNGKTIYIDPAGGAKAFKNKKLADLVLITDIHSDHMDIETLDSLDLSKAEIIAPQAVAEKLPAKYTDHLIILNNGEIKEVQGISIEAVPMYNLREEALKYHDKGRGNGYIITLGKKRLYFSGDTEDIPEMRALQYIDMAFICMNLPYTMTVESAASAVLDFKPKQVYPYHYRGTEGLSDVAKFKELVSRNPDIEVVQLDWYPDNTK
ncbi:L-ascorbate metabolism protein UlaG (beta-lactamase superfamily) [Aquimarina sp. MAR_2010_214]|uniref:MBL fold metallo-hydrolase n=1 Tax=Aquimarina sp. MAR_2010_214 TaxID=1250026 RepID=UPI000C706D43|nr:MBL fold metallo-hydrolase [Aquimarina sp. MAR_2010_214]PKV51465.1 L-ascorbate metabolism protein UlaG (beta-lactamase superfamily) [Aquimarina sp. MAR_2010_214]